MPCCYAEGFDAYGNPSNPTIGTPFQYQGAWGGYTDSETGLVLQGHRYYDPATGTWLTRDPIGQAGGVNVYGYVGGDPVNWNDEDGLKKKKRGGIGGWWDDRVNSAKGYWEWVTSYKVTTVRKLSEVWSAKMVRINKWVDHIDTTLKEIDLCHQYITIRHNVQRDYEWKVAYKKSKRYIDVTEEQFDGNGQWKWKWLTDSSKRNLKDTNKMTKGASDAVDGSVATP
jgi:RHS repeat-associated protein